jgi:hypothetical protein
VTGTATGLLAVSVLGIGCASSSPALTQARPPASASATTSPPPSTAADCGAASDPGSPDGGVVAGLDWPAGARQLHTPALAYVCVGRFAGSTLVIAQSGGTLTVTPTRFVLPESASGVFPVTITADQVGRTALRLRLISPTGKPQVDRAVATVVAEPSGWRFERPTD